MYALLYLLFLILIVEADEIYAVSKKEPFGLSLDVSALGLVIATSLVQWVSKSGPQTGGLNHLGAC